MKGLMTLALVATLLAASGCSSQGKRQAVEPEIKPVNVYTLDVVGADSVSFSGYVNFDEYRNRQGVSGAIYSGYSGAAFLASVLTHAAIASSIDSAQMKNFVEESNAVVEIYQPIIKAFTTAELTNGLFSPEKTPFLVGDFPLVDAVSESSLPLGIIRVQPEFVLSQDSSGFLVESTFEFSDLRKPRVVKKRNVRMRASKNKKPESKVIIINDPVAEEPVSYWSGNNGEILKKRSQDLFSESISLYLEYSAPNKARGGKHETIKYALGPHLRIERGIVLDRSCRRLVFRSLRGWIKSVPVHSDYLKDNPACHMGSEQDLARSVH